jgi:hypothetical protein
MARHLQGCAYAGVVGLFLLNPAHASVLTGDLIQAEYDYPIPGSVYGASTVIPNPFVVGTGLETVISIEDVTFLNVDFSDGSLLITLITILDNPTWNSVSQNGPAFTVLSGNPFPAISSVTSTSGPVSAFISGGTLFINWAGMSYHTGDTVSVSFETPLPPALPLFVSGLTGFGFFGWWRRRKNETI